MGPASLVFANLVMLLSMGRIILGIWLLTAPLPLRDGVRWRVPVAIVGLELAYAAVMLAILVPLGTFQGVGFSVAQLFIFSLLLIACVVATLFVYDTNVWTAIFCCSAGYTIQNLASGATELVWTLAGGGFPGGDGYYTPLRFCISFVCTAVVYVAAYLLITRYLRREGLERIEDRRMLLLVVMTIFVIIGFDVVIKWLVEQGIATGAMVLLRVFHGLACSFTLLTGFELLVRRRVEAERDTLTQVLAEHERQYEAARDNIDAINARVHDIRHAVGHLADDGGMDRAVIRDLIRTVDVYDSKVRTGNEALDTALTEQRLRFGRAGVSLACVADGAVLSFMAPADVYTFFSSVLEAVLEARPASASLVVRQALGATSVHVEGSETTFEGTLPQQARDVVTRYRGSLSAEGRDGSFHVNALFPSD